MNIVILLSFTTLAKAAFLNASPELSLSNSRLSSSRTELAGVRNALQSAIGKKSSDERRDYSGFGQTYTRKNNNVAGGGYLGTLEAQRQPPRALARLGNVIDEGKSSISRTVPAAKSAVRSAKEKAKKVSSPVANTIRTKAGNIWGRLTWKRSKKSEEQNISESPPPAFDLKTYTQNDEALECDVATAVIKEAKMKTQLLREHLEKKQYEAKSNVDQLMADLK